MLYKKLVLGFFTITMVAVLATMGLASPTNAANSAPDVANLGLADDSTTSLIQLTGTVATITPQNGSVLLVTLTDGTQLLVNPATVGAENLTVGQPITVIASLDDDGETLVAKTIAPDLATLQPTDSATSTLEATGTPVATEVSGETPEATSVATGTAMATCGGPNAHPVATRLAAAFGVSYDEIMSLHCQGIGFGNIAKAYLLAKKTGKNAADFFALRKSGEGWGQIMKGANVKPSELSLGQAVKGQGKKAGPTSASPSTDSKGKGKGNGKGKGK